MGWASLENCYKSFEQWQEAIYPEVIASAPRYKGPKDERRIPDFVKRHIKMMWTTGERGIRYKAIGVPGGTVKGSPAHHAYMAIMSLHLGRRAFPIYGRPILTFPVAPGTTFRNPQVARQGPGRERGRRNWVVTRKVFQPSWPAGKYPWIADISFRRLSLLDRILRINFIRAKKKCGVMRVAVG